MTTSGPLIVALDLATNTGFCIGRPGEMPRFGTWRLKGPEDAAERAFGNLVCRLRDEFRLEIPDSLVYEAPISPGALRQEVVHNGTTGEVLVKKVRQTNAKTTYLLVGLAAIAAGLPWAWGVRSKPVSVQSVRKSVLGMGFPPNPKRAVMARCRQLGYAVQDDNAADAVALWLHQGMVLQGRSLHG